MVRWSVAIASALPVRTFRVSKSRKLYAFDQEYPFVSQRARTRRDAAGERGQRARRSVVAIADLGEYGPVVKQMDILDQMPIAFSI